MITPYQYTYLNIFNGKKESNYKRFENDYWGASLKELMEKIDFDSLRLIDFSGVIIDCIFGVGLNREITGKYLKLINIVNSLKIK